ncbi:MAG: UDP-N-acetylglucosamine 1-carboxyvinyltransferase [Oscillospiraceae bacterium]|nr:UDP-N-acetylglucosamine 1-carboxyvinyltransferase [Oscillospiraceae bacterium]
MTVYTIQGGKKLKGEAFVGGAKNAAVAILPACVLCAGKVTVENIPRISDVTTMLEILRSIGAQVRLTDSTTVEIDASGISSRPAPYDLARSMRASYYLIGATLGRFGKAREAMPGGCDLGVRPIDQHIKGFRALGAHVLTEGGYIAAEGRNGLTGANIYLDMASVGATINIMLASCLASGMTLIDNAAKEPHIVDLANFLNAMGADIKGAGTDVIKIRGKQSLAGGTYAIIPDQIEAGTFMAAAAAAGGDVTVTNVIPKHLECITAKLCEMGVDVEEYDDAVRVVSGGKLTAANVKTLPYPGFPTDMQPQMAACMSLAEGTSMITESVSDNRYKYVDELRRMGAHITVDGKVAVIEGARRLTGAPVSACDLRAGAAMIIAALAASGRTTIEGVRHIERGYEDIVDKLRALGADIRRREHYAEKAKQA